MKKQVISRSSWAASPELEAYQWMSGDGSYILIPLGPRSQSVKFLIDIFNTNTPGCQEAGGVIQTAKSF